MLQRALILRPPASRPKRLVAAVVCACVPLWGVWQAGDAAAALTTKVYVKSDAPLANPERGFLHQDLHCADHELVVDELEKARQDEQITLLRCVFYLREFKHGPISQGRLDRLRRHAQAAEDAGVKLVLRFAYTDEDDESDPEYAEDASPTQVLAHLDQLADPLRDHANVIAVLESGFVGLWGEGGTSRHFGDYPALSDGHWLAREQLLRKLLDILPANRRVLVRTPLQKRHPFGSAAATAADFAAGNEKGRVGHLNDCFLATDTDMGTYNGDPAIMEEEREYLAADTGFVPMGGETCEVFRPRSECATAKEELKRFHWSYLNADYEQLVLKDWSNGGCLPAVQRRLGYRLRLVSTRSATTVRRGGELRFRMVMRNTGYAGTINPRRVFLVLRRIGRPRVIPREYRISLGTTSDWTADSKRIKTCRLPIPARLPLGKYRMSLGLPDPSPALSNRLFSIQLANVGLWDSQRGRNNLRRTVKVQQRLAPVRSRARQSAVPCTNQDAPSG